MILVEDDLSIISSSQFPNSHISSMSSDLRRSIKENKAQ